MAAKGHCNLTDQEWVDLNKGATAGLPRWEPILLIMMVIGVIGIVIGLITGGSRQVHSVWLNFLYWGGIAQASVTFAALYHLFRGGWGPTMVRLGLVQTSYTVLLPVLFLICIVPVAKGMLPWENYAKYEAYHHLQGFGFKAFWLNLPFMLIRDFAILVILAAVNVKFMNTILRAERGALAEIRQTTLPQGWEGLEIEREKSRSGGVTWAIILVICFVLGYSFIGFDMIMALEPMWYSTMFGGYFFVTCIFMALAALVLWSVALRKRMGVQSLIGSTQFHDVGKLMLAFTVLSGYTCFSQYLPIWYGDMPEEIEYLLVRRDHPVWGFMGHFLFLGGFVVLLVVLVNQWVKLKGERLAFVAVWALLIGFLERNLTIMPPLRGLEVESVFFGVFGPIEFCITIGFAGLYIFTVLQGLRRTVIVPGPWKVPPVAF